MLDNGTPRNYLPPFSNNLFVAGGHIPGAPGTIRTMSSPSSVFPDHINASVAQCRIGDIVLEAVRQPRSIIWTALPVAAWCTGRWDWKV